MRYPKDHGQQTRRRIVENASYGLRQNGADGLSVVDLMKLADLTHGSFYAYFKSRDALVVEALALAMDRTVAHWLDLTQGLPAEKGFRRRRRGLSEPSPSQQSGPRLCASGVSRGYRTFWPGGATYLCRQAGENDRYHRRVDPEEIAIRCATGRRRRNCDYGRFDRARACGR